MSTTTQEKGMIFIGGALAGMAICCLAKHMKCCSSSSSSSCHGSKRAGQSKDSIKLTYFDIEGLAEKVRLTFAIGGVEFTDVRVKQTEWDTLKPQTKFGTLPMLEMNGKVYTQSEGMLRYAGKITGLYPSCPLKALKVDEAIGIQTDLGNSLLPSLIINRDQSLTEEEKKKKILEMRTAVRETELPKYFGFLERLLEENGTGYFVGNSITIADISIVQLMRWITSGKLDGIPTTIVDNYPRLNQLKALVEQHPAVQKWRSSRTI